MIMDKFTEFSNQQAVTASVESDNCMDISGVMAQGANARILIDVTETVTAAGGATVVFELQCDNDVAFGSPKTVVKSAAIPKATLGAGYKHYLPIPVGLDETYARLYYTVANGPLTAGKFTARVAEREQSWQAFPDSI
jgi:hypothetical protein